MTTKNIIIVILMVLSANILSAQTVSSYILPTKPQLVLENGGKVYVEPLVNTGEKAPEFGNKYSATLSALINKNAADKGRIKGVYNSWYTNKLYTVVSSESDADYIIKGTYLIEASSSYEYTEIKSIAKLSNIPYFTYQHTNSVKASLNGTLNVVNASSSNILTTVPLTATKSDSKIRYIHNDGPFNADNYIKSIAKKTIRGYSGVFTPKYVAKKYSFKKAKANKKTMEKADFKATKKELKAQQKAIKILAEQGKIKEMGAMYLKIAAMGDKIKNLSKVEKNIAYCYELIGNYTKAKIYYTKAGDSISLELLTKLIDMQQFIKKLGHDVTEEEF